MYNKSFVESIFRNEPSRIFPIFYTGWRYNNIVIKYHRASADIHWHQYTYIYYRIQTSHTLTHYPIKFVHSYIPGGQYDSKALSDLRIDYQFVTRTTWNSFTNDSFIQFSNTSNWTIPRIAMLYRYTGWSRNNPLHPHHRCRSSASYNSLRTFIDLIISPRFCSNSSCSNSLYRVTVQFQTRFENTVAIGSDSKAIRSTHNHRRRRLILHVGPRLSSLYRVIV